MTNNELKLVDFFKPEGFNDRIILYFGKNDLENYTGDKWEITPYEDIAGQIKQNVEIKLYYLFTNTVAFQPVNNWSKNDLKYRKTPCLIIVPKQIFVDDFGFDIDTTAPENRPWPLYDLCLGHEKIVKIYFGDSFDKITNELNELITKTD